MTFLARCRHRTEDALGIGRRCEHTFYGAALKQGAVVIDLGGNRGEFSEHLSRTYGCRCIVVEPVPGLCSQIRKTDLIQPVQAAISDHDGEIPFFVNADSTFGNILGEIPNTRQQLTVPCLTFEALLEKCGLWSVDLLKIDIEGAEIQLFDSTSDRTLCGIDQITIEFHDFMDEARLPEFTEKIAARLERLGFLPTLFGSRMDVLFINTKRIKLPLGVHAYLLAVNLLFGLRGRSLKPRGRK